MIGRVMSDNKLKGVGVIESDLKGDFAMKTRVLLLTAAAMLLAISVQAQMGGQGMMKGEKKGTMMSMKAMTEQMQQVMDRMGSMHSMMKQAWPETGEKMGGSGMMSGRAGMMMGMMDHMQDMGMQMQGMLGQMQNMMADADLMKNADTKANLEQMQSCMSSMTQCMDEMTTYMDQMSKRYMPEKAKK